MNKKKFFKNFIKRGALASFILLSTVILIESGLDGTTSGSHSNTITDPIENNMNENYDKDKVKDIKDFNVNIKNVEGNTINGFVNEIYNFDYTYVPSDTSFKEIDYKIVDPNIVKVNGDSKTINLLKEGSTTISFYSKKKPEELIKNININVSEIPLTDFKLNIEKINLNVGQNFKIKVKEYIPSNATDINITYYFKEKQNIITFDEKSGEIKAINPGTVNLYVIHEGKNKIEKKVEIIVNKVEETKYEVEQLEIDLSSINYLNENVKSRTIKGKYYPSNASFDPELLNISYVDTYLNIDNISYGNGNFSFKISLKEEKISEICNDFIENIYVSYNKLDAIKIDLNIKKLLEYDNNSFNCLNNDIKKSINKFISYGNNSFEQEMLSINVPFKKLENNLYNNKKYKREYNTNIFDLNKASYSSIRLKPKSNLINDFNEVVKYYPNINNQDLFISFNISYKLNEISVKIEDFNLLNLKEDQVNILYAGHGTYTNLLNYEISVNESNNNSSYNLIHSNLIFSGYDKNKIEINQNDLIIKDPTFNDTIILKVESEILSNFAKDENIIKEYKIEIRNKENIEPTIKELTINSTLNDSKTYLNDEIPTNITLGKNEILTFNFVTYYETKLNNNYSYKDLISDDFDIKIKNNDNKSIFVDEKNKYIKGIKDNGDKAQLILSSGNTTININIDVNYIPIDIKEFNIDIVTINNVLHNEVDIDKESLLNSINKIPLGYKFKLIPNVNDDATNKKFNFISTNEESLSIDNKGNAEVKKFNDKIITISIISQDDLSIKKDIKFKIVNTTAPFTLVNEGENGLNAPKFELLTDNNTKKKYYNIELYYGETYKLKLNTIVPSTSKNIRYEHLDLNDNLVKEEIVSVSKDGTISTKKVGHDYIKITYGQNSEGESLAIKEYNAYLKIYVYRNTKFSWGELSMMVRKGLGHFGLFAITSTAALFFICLQFKRYDFKIYGILVSSVIGFLIAGLSELIQKYTPGRGPSWVDVGIDFAGYISVILITLLSIGIIVLTKYIINKKQNKNKKIDQ